MSSQSPAATRGPIYRLPLDLKHAIVVDAIAAEDGSCEDRGTARSLALVDKELLGLVRPILFTALGFRRRSLAALRDFIDLTPASIKQLVQSVDLRDNNSADGLDSFTELGRSRRELCAELLRSPPTLADVSFPFPIHVWNHENLEMLYVFDSKLGGPMRKLCIDGGNLILPTLLSRTPNLRQLTLKGQLSFHEDLNVVLSTLTELATFEVHFLALGSTDLDAPIAWGARLESMVIDLSETGAGDLNFLEVLNHFFVGASATLVELKVGLAAAEAVAWPPFALPSLITLELTAPNPFHHLSLFAESRYVTSL